MKITHRVVSKKGHTKGYVVDGKMMTRGRVVRLAERGHFEGVVVKSGVYNTVHDKYVPKYISSVPTNRRSLYDLPVVPEEKYRRKAAR